MKRNYVVWVDNSVSSISCEEIKTSDRFFLLFIGGEAIAVLDSDVVRKIERVSKFEI